MKKHKKIIIFLICIGLLFFLWSFLGDYIGNKVVNLENTSNNKDEELNNRYGYLKINPNKFKNVDEYLKTKKDKLEKYGINFEKENFSVGLFNESKEFIGYMSYNKDDANLNISNDIKNLSIYTIEEGLQNDSVFGGRYSKSLNKIIPDYERVHPQTDVLNLFFSGKQNPFKLISEYNSKTLNDLKKMTNEDLELYSYLNELVGDYEKANSVRKITNNKKDKVVIDGIIKDSLGEPVKGTKVTLLNNDKSVLTDEKGYYKIESEMFPLAHLRVSVDKKGYSGGNKVYFLNDTEFDIKEHYIGLDFVMYKVQEYFSFDNKKALEYSNGNFLVIDTKDKFKYFIPKNGLYDIDGNNFSFDNGELEINLYNFTRTDDTQNFLLNDSLNQDIGFLGNQMVTFGMPYIQFYDKKSGKQLYSLEDNPVVLQAKITHFNEIFNDEEKLYGEISKSDVKKMYNDSISSDGYPINFAYLKENDLLAWPVRWIFDSITGIWYDTGHRLIDEKGTVEVNFYQTKKIIKK